MNARSTTLPPLYPIVNVADAGDESCARAVALATELADAGATLLQLRAKPLGAGAMTELALRILEALAGSAARLVVNDRADVAAACGAAGVHLGDGDVPPAVARRALAGLTTGADRLVGYSTHSVQEAADASSTDVDYIGFGPVFDSPTKAGVRTPRGLELLAQACAASARPVVAIGGVTLEGAVACWRAGAASVAVIREIETSGDRRALLAAYRRAAADCGLGEAAGRAPSPSYS